MLKPNRNISNYLVPGRHVHLVGIGGVGMSALAQAYIDAGWAVSGSDRALASSGPRPAGLRHPCHPAESLQDAAGHRG